MNEPKRRARNVKITLTTCLAGPQGVGRPGTVLNLPEDQAKELIQQRSAREFDSLRDRKAHIGLVQAGQEK